MALVLEPLLARQRELYDLPKGFARFRRYLDVMRGGTADMELPLSAMNPMGKPHVADRLDALIALGAEDVARESIREAGSRLPVEMVEFGLRVALVVADDAEGGWTNRYTTEMAQRFGRSGELNRDWVVVLLWSSESPSPDRVQAEVLASIYRSCHRLRHGHAETLGSMLQQEGRSAAFAGLASVSPVASPAPEEPAELDEVREIIRPFLETRDFPVQFACLYGDEIADSLGYRSLGLPRFAGYRFAAWSASQAAETPESFLTAR